MNHQGTKGTKVMFRAGYLLGRAWGFVWAPVKNDWLVISVFFTVGQAVHSGAFTGSSLGAFAVMGLIALCLARDWRLGLNRGIEIGEKNGRQIGRLERERDELEAVRDLMRRGNRHLN